MAAVSIEMRSLMEGGSSTEQIDEARLYIRNLPSHVARHTTSTVMRNQVTTRRKSRGTSVKRSGALRRHVISVASEPVAAKIVILCYFCKSFSHLLHQAFLQNNIEANFLFKRIVFVINLPLVCFLKILKLTGELRAIHAGI